MTSQVSAKAKVWPISNTEAFHELGRALQEAESNGAPERIAALRLAVAYFGGLAKNDLG